MTSSSILRRGLAIVAVAACGAAWAAPNANDPYAGQYDVLTAPQHSQFNYRQGELIVKFRTDVATPIRLKGSKGMVKANASASALNALLSKYGVEEADELMPLTGAIVTPKTNRARSLNGQEMNDSDLSSLYVLRLDQSANIQDVAQEFAALAEVEYAEPNFIVYACSTGTAADYTADPLYTQQWGIPAIGLDQLWGAPVVNAKRPVIAILDTGVDITHPDLADNIWTNEIEANGADGRDDDGNGFKDDIHGWDFVNQSPRMRDNNGHGTHCAGIAAAVGGNGIGITGANPDALIMPITILQSDGTGDIATIIKGIDYAAANGADVLSMSFGGYYDSQAERDALAKAYQKAVLVAAAGNDNMCIYLHTCTINQIKGAPMFPAAYSFVLGVEASANAQGGLASFSNYDDDGPITSTFAGLYNYELHAPGTSIISTFPGGQYKALNGTSMACPLAAGAISRLLMVREISTKEELFGDLIHSTKGNINIFDAYSLTDADRKPTLALVTYRLDDEKMGDGDGRPDAGETIRIYPTFRNSWGNARNITYSIRLAETEDPEIVEFMDGESHFISNLSSYASAEAESPFILKINPNCVDGRHITLVLTATCDNISAPLEQTIVLNVENGVELGGVISEDMTLTPDKNYIVTSFFGVPEGVTLTILPGTTIKFKDGTAMTVSGNIVAHGEPGNMITFTRADGALGNIQSINFGNKESNTVSYAVIKDLAIANMYGIMGVLEHSIYTYCSANYILGYSDWRYSNLINLTGSYGLELQANQKNFCNIVRNKQRGVNSPEDAIRGRYISSSNSFNNKFGDINMSLGYVTSDAVTYTPKCPNYHGTGSTDIARTRILDIYNPLSGSFGEYNLKNMLTRPYYDAHGIVWKVVVNGYDAQDEYELLPPLGVGRHKFEVYFSRTMNHDKAPMIAMGVREPYTQIAISEDGEWRTEMLPYNPLGQELVETNVLNGNFNESYYTGWSSEGCELYFGYINYPNFDGNCLYSYSHQTGAPNKLYHQIELAQNGRYKLTISAKVNTLAENNDCQYVYLNDTKTYLDENALNGAVYEVIADVYDNFIEVGIEQTENISDYMYIDNVSLTLLEEYSNERLVPTDIYTAYLTIKGKDNFDGVNTIYVAEAEDDEFFEIPIEDVRFHVNVQSAGSMSSGFMAEPGVGRVTLTWENPEDNFDDMLGYNLYRYTLNDNYEPGETIRLNEQLLDTEEFVDYDIVPGTTYNYYYKVLRTSLDENAPSKVVSATPRAAGKGDANASGDVDVADVVTEVNYMVGRNPKPFMFEAADINGDADIDILDVVGTVNIIMQPADAQAMALASAVYTVADGILYVDCTSELSGIQVDLSGERGTQILALDALRGMESAGDWLSDAEYRFVSFSLSGKTVQSGRQAILAIGDADVEGVILVDRAGRRVAALRSDDASGISAAVGQQMRLPYPNPFDAELNVPVTIATDGQHRVGITLTNLAGASMAAKRCNLGYGEHVVTVPTGALPAGFYIVTLTVDGKDIQSVKAIKK